MKIPQRLFPLAFGCALAFGSLPTITTAAAKTSAHVVEDNAMPSQQQQVGALQRGYRTGYSDGYQVGWRDSAERAARNYQNKADYQRADRAYASAYGALEDYRDGYQQGFEAGYDSGYEHRGFDSTVPESIARRGVQSGTERRVEDETTSVNSSSNSTSGANRDPAPSTTTRIPGAIPAGTVLRVELLNRLSSDVSQRGDRFEARVLEPSEYEGAVVSGRVSRVDRSGKVRGTAELQLSFDQIRLADGNWQDFSAQLVEVVRAGDDEGIGEVDTEGGVRGRSSTKDDVAKVGAGAGLGAIIGAIAGGGKGAAIGAAIGGGAATGGVLSQRGKDIRLERGQQMTIRTSRSERIN